MRGNRAILLVTVLAPLLVATVYGHTVVSTPTPVGLSSNADCVYEQNQTCTCSLKPTGSGICARFDSDIDVNKGTAYCTKDSCKGGGYICDCSGDLLCDMQIQRIYVLDEIPKRRLLHDTAKCHVEERWLPLPVQYGEIPFVKAYASSVYEDHIPEFAIGAGAHGTDLEGTPSCFHAGLEDEPWFIAEFARPAKVNHLIFTRRMDCEFCKPRIYGMVVTVGGQNCDVPDWKTWDDAYIRIDCHGAIGDKVLIHVPDRIGTFEVCGLDAYGDSPVPVDPFSLHLNSLRSPADDYVKLEDSYFVSDINDWAVKVWSTAILGAPADEPNVFKTEGHSDKPLQLKIPVDKGTYKVVLKFSEHYYQNAGERVFDATVNGQTLPNIDVVAEVGKLTALEKEFVVSATDAIDILLDPKVSRVFLNGITIDRTNDPLDTKFTLRINSWVSDADDYVKLENSYFISDRAKWYVKVWNDAVAGAPAINRQNVFNSEGHSDEELELKIPVPAGNYKVTLQWSEHYYEAAGERVFDVDVNGMTLTDLDVFALVGGETAHEHSFIVAATDSITIKETPKISRVFLNGIIIEETTLSPVAPFELKLSSWTSPADDYVKLEDSYFVTPRADWFIKVYTMDTVANAPANEQNVFNSEGHSPNPLELKIPVPAGDYYVTLKWSEHYLNAAGARIFDVDVNGEQLLNLDVWSRAGGKLRAYEYTFQVTATDSIVVKETPKTSRITLNGIHISQVPQPAEPDTREYFAKYNSLRSIADDYPKLEDSFFATPISDWYGKTWSDSVANAPSNEQAVYNSEGHSANPLELNIPVPMGSYKVTLKFSEHYFNAAGKRIFNVYVGSDKLLDLDVFALVGRYTAYNHEFVVTSTTNLKIRLEPKVSRIFLDGITIEKL